MLVASEQLRRSAGWAPKLPRGLPARTSWSRGDHRTKVFKSSGQAVFQRHLRFPVKELSGARDVRLPLLGVVDRQVAVLDAAPRPAEAQDLLRELEHGDLVRVAEVDRELVAAVEGREDATHQVRDVAEAAGLRAVAVDRQWLAADGPGHEVRHCAAITD